MNLVKKNQGITLIALVISIIVLLILAGVTINAISGSESAPAKANEAGQKNDIGAAKDDISLTATNAKLQGMETAYVGNGVSAENASTTVGQAVINAVLEKNETNFGKAFIEVKQKEENNVKGDAYISIYTTDFVVDGTITIEDGILTWGEIEPNIPSIRIINAPSTLDIGKNVTLQTEIKRVKDIPTISWSSNNSNSEFATVNSEGKVTGIAEGDATITAEIEVGGTKYIGTCKITIVTPPPAPQIGDFVNYNAGTWTRPEITALGSLYSVEASTNYTFGGFTEGSSRNTSIAPSNTNNNGWQILDTEEINGTTYITKIIHAGSPEKYNHPGSYYSAYKSQYILNGEINPSATSAWNYNQITVRNWNMYRDTDWATTESKTYANPDEDVKLITKSEIESSDYSSKLTTGGQYWLPLASSHDGMYYVGGIGNVGTGYSSCNGVRPVVTLKSGVTVKGTGTDHSTPDKAWELQ